MRLRVLSPALFAITALGAAVGLHRMGGILDFALIGPGYLVQAWLFEKHWALGGLGYELTIIGVSALFWTSFLIGLYVSIRGLYRRLVRQRA